MSRVIATFVTGPSARYALVDALGEEPGTVVAPGVYRSAGGRVLGLRLAIDWELVEYTAEEARTIHANYLESVAREHDARAEDLEERARLSPRYAAGNLQDAARERALGDEFRDRAAAVRAEANGESEAA